MRKLLLLALIGALVGIMVAAGVLIVANPASTRGAEHLDYGQAIQIDDFAFTATSSERTNHIGDATPQGIFYVVPFKVMNRAKVVPFRFRLEMARLEDNMQVQHLPSAQAMAQWFAANGQSDGCVQEIAAGTECSTVLVFDVPADTQAPVLKVQFGDGLLQVADALAFGNRVIQLR